SLDYPHTTDTSTLSLHDRSSDLQHIYGGTYRVGVGVIGVVNKLVATAQRAGLHAASHRIESFQSADDGRQRQAGGYATSGGGKRDRKSTRLNSSHVKISYAVFCL